MSEKPKSNSRKPTEPELEVIKCAARVAVSLAAIVTGSLLIALKPDLSEWGTAMIGFVVGYWLK